MIEIKIADVMTMEASNKVDTNWKVLVVDGRLSVHKATELLFDNMSFAGKRFETIASYSLGESKEVLRSDSSIALVLMDVEIGGENIGLDLIDFIRKDLQNEKIRIVLRSGYPDPFPEEEIARKYHIDGCLPEEEVSLSQFEFVVLGAIQTYHQIISVTTYLQGFAGSVAHEMRNSLTLFGLNFSAVKNELFLLKKKYPQANMEVFKSLVNSGIRLCKRSDMIVDMIFKNIKEERIDKDSFEVISMAQTINTTLEEFAYSNLQNKEKFDLDLVQDFEFRGDENAFIFVLFNLFKNSLFYLVNKPDGKIQIRLENGKDMNTLYFKDNGLGIPKDKLSSIFDNFMTYGKKEGTGLGLAFCKRVMIAFGGDVTCQSEYGQWTQFVLTFPKCHF